LKALGDQQGLSASLHQLAILEMEQGSLAEARRLWERSIGISQDIGNIAGRARALCMLARLDANEGMFDTARAMAHEAVALLEGIEAADAAQARAILKDIETEAVGRAESVRLHGEAIERLRAGEAAGALERFERSLAAARGEGNAHNEAVILLALGHTLLELGHVAEAADRLREGLAVAEGLGDADLLKSLQMLATIAAQRQAGGEDSPP
jgi:tetratricopeptide (TPR) repeat protein